MLKSPIPIDKKGRELEAGEPIHAEDIKACLAKQGTSIRPGDDLLIHTGWMRWFKEDPKKFMSGDSKCRSSA